MIESHLRPSLRSVAAWSVSAGGNSQASGASAARDRRNRREGASIAAPPAAV